MILFLYVDDKDMKNVIYTCGGYIYTGIISDYILLAFVGN